MTDILTSPVWWSTSFAFLVVIVGLKHYINKMLAEDKKIKAKREKTQSSDDKNKTDN